MRKGHGERDMRVLLRVVRVGFVALMLIVMLLYTFGISLKDDSLDISIATNWVIPVAVALVLSGVFLGIDLLTPRKKIATITGVVFGLLAGLVATVVLSSVIDLVVQTWDIQAAAIVSSIKVLLGVSLAFLGITSVLQTQDDFRLVIPYVEFAKQIRGPRPMVVDTSVLIDARIVDIAATGLIQQSIVIPEFVLEELQALADSSDRAKRDKGRRGLDMVGKLQRMGTLDVVIDSTPVLKKGVDQALVELALTLKAMLVTLDTGLARIALIQDVPVLNIHDLSNALKPTVIPGSSIRVELVKAGEQDGQGVGYLEDGTMVVVEDGGEDVGRVVDAIITSSMQTAAGRLLFARMDMVGREGERSGGVREAEVEPVEVGVEDGSVGGGGRGVGRPKVKRSARNPRR